MEKDLTRGNVIRTMLLFAAPMILGNLLQQCYNIADSLIVGRFLGPGALAAVGSAYTLMTFLTSVLIGLCMGSGSLFSFYFGKNQEESFQKANKSAFLFICLITILLNGAAFWGIDLILKLLKVPRSVYGIMREYVWIIFAGIFFVFLYNYFAYLLRAVGNSLTPLYFLAVAAVLNIFLDLLFVAVFSWGIKGAAVATVLAQAISGVGIGLYTVLRHPKLRPVGGRFAISGNSLWEVVRFSVAACIQQSVMNFGILMIQGLVNSFGNAVMAAFAAAVKIDTLAYMPAQEFANAYSLFISQNHGANKTVRLKQGTKWAIGVSCLFCVIVSIFVYITSPRLMGAFLPKGELEIIAIGTGYLRIEGACYCGIGLLFLLYGYFRGMGRPEMSIVLTVISLGMRVLLAYVLAPVPKIGVYGIWWAIPIGWLLADVAGCIALKRSMKVWNICSD